MLIRIHNPDGTTTEARPQAATVADLQELFEELAPGFPSVSQAIPSAQHLLEMLRAGRTAEAAWHIDAMYPNLYPPAWEAKVLVFGRSRDEVRALGMAWGPPISVGCEP